jgi:formylglycine-generating enzyme required for sulfatase activity
MSWLESGFSRVARGGSWSLDPRYARFARRDDFTRGSRYYALGFRLLRRVS